MGKLKAVGRFIRSVLCHLTGGTKVYHLRVLNVATKAMVLVSVQASSEREAISTASGAGYSYRETIAVVLPFEQKASV